ncbi:Uncharacterised protein [Chromobacterium violaceum]|uniref:Uncharacterized protein n=1 Tax=Chromobacterium violaceum TaxID=536 RepID=A0AAX2MBW6_CHRVL|nr:Uncharacterised protein [Chromobacterium violaceum]
MADFDAFEVLGQRLTAATGARFARGVPDCRRRRIQFDLHRRQILVGIVFKQRPLFGGQRFALGAEAHAPEVSELEHQLLVLEFEGLNLQGLFGELPHHVLHPGDERRIGDVLGKSGKQIHCVIIS